MTFRTAVRERGWRPSPEGTHRAYGSGVDRIARDLLLACLRADLRSRRLGARSRRPSGTDQHTCSDTARSVMYVDRPLLRIPRPLTH